MRRLVGDAAYRRISWLEPARSLPASLTGYDVEGWPAAIWVLHAMYECADAGRALRPGDDPFVDLERGAVATGVPLGFVRRPEPPWQRIRWAEVAAREGFSLGVDATVPPSTRWFPYDAWPADVLPPPEGSLDEASLAALLRNVVRPSNPDGCAYFGAVTAGVFDELVVYAGDLRDVGELAVRRGMTPSNFWPDDRSWLVYTDWDLMATRVGGSRELIAALAADGELETMRWP